MSQAHRSAGKVVYAVLALLVGVTTAATQTKTDPLKSGFENPPEGARPRVWWHWMNGNISKEGIKLDLEWMHRVGLGGYQNFDAALSTPQVVPKRLAYMTPEWKDAFKYAVVLGDQLGLEEAIAGSPGWSESGGPWVPASQGMKKYVWSETPVEGGQAFTGTVAHPPSNTGAFQNLSIQDLLERPEGSKPIPEFYADAAVVAYRAPARAASASTTAVACCLHAFAQARHGRRQTAHRPRLGQAPRLGVELQLVTARVRNGGSQRPERRRPRRHRAGPRRIGPRPAPPCASPGRRLRGRLHGMEPQHVGRPRRFVATIQHQADTSAFRTPPAGRELILGRPLPHQPIGIDRRCRSPSALRNRQSARLIGAALPSGTNDPDGGRGSTAWRGRPARQSPARDKAMVNWPSNLSRAKAALRLALPPGEAGAAAGLFVVRGSGGEDGGADAARWAAARHGRRRRGRPPAIDAGTTVDVGRCLADRLVLQSRGGAGVGSYLDRGGASVGSFRAVTPGLPGIGSVAPAGCTDRSLPEAAGGDAGCAGPMRTTPGFAAWSPAA